MINDDLSELYCNPSDLIPTMTPIPEEARRRLVQATAEIGASIASVPSGLMVYVAIENLLSAIDTYDAESKAAGRG